MNYSKHWLTNPPRELLLILAPLFVPVVLVAIFQDYFETNREVPTIWWLLLVLMIDVGHVYSTLFRFYWEGPTFHKHRSLLVAIPLLCFFAGMLIHSYNPFAFWRLLAYLAVFHFIRQQYGFMRLYSRKELNGRFSKWVDSLAVYSATLYPVLYWHFFLTGELSWFVPGDFPALSSTWLIELSQYLYWAILITFVAKELYLWKAAGDRSAPKILLVAGTYISWYAGIIYFSGDLAFTMLNVVSHGIPYMGLIWMYGEKKATRNFNFNWRGALIFFMVIFVLAYFEESIWDVLIWKDHPALFPFLTEVAPLKEPAALSILVPLLVVPQLTHYILDGFIWKFSKDATARINSNPID